MANAQAEYVWVWRDRTGYLLYVGSIHPGYLNEGEGEKPVEGDTVIRVRALWEEH